jgi:hypothetical protein
MAVLPVLTYSQITLPLLPNPTFNLLSAETIVLQQLGSWGINISISLDIPQIASTKLGLDIQPRVLPVKELNQYNRQTRSRSRSRGLSLNLGLGTGGNIGAEGKYRYVFGSVGSLLKDVRDAVGQVVPVMGQQGWGQADDVAKGEQGDQAVGGICF